MRDPLLCGRAAFVYRVVGGRNRPHTYHASVDSTLLPAVMDQIVVKKRDFDRPPTLLPSLEKGGDNVVMLCIALTARPRMAGWCPAVALVDHRNCFATCATVCVLVRMSEH